MVPQYARHAHRSAEPGLARHRSRTAHPHPGSARETLRTVNYCIVDEIHAVCANKRGVFLALLLERLAALTERPFVRIGLSATQRPLEEVVRYLGGCELSDEGALTPRPVTIID